MENCNTAPELTLGEKMLVKIRDSLPLQPAYRMSLDRHLSSLAERTKCERKQEPRKEYTEVDKQNLLDTASGLLNNAIAAKRYSMMQPFDASAAARSQQASEVAAKAGLDLARTCRDWGEFDRLVTGKNPDFNQLLPIIRESMIAQNGSDPFIQKTSSHTLDSQINGSGNAPKWVPVAASASEAVSESSITPKIVLEQLQAAWVSGITEDMLADGQPIGGLLGKKINNLFPMGVGGASPAIRNLFDRIAGGPLPTGTSQSPALSPLRVNQETRKLLYHLTQEVQKPGSSKAG